MKAFSSVNDRLGLSKRQLAQFLNVNVALLTRIEQGTRTPSTELIVRKNWLENVLLDPARLVSPAIQSAIDAAIQKQLESANDDLPMLQMQRFRLQQRLEAMKAKYQQALELLAVIHGARQKPEVMADEMATAWLDMQEQEALYISKENTPVQQHQLQTRIDCLQTQIESWVAFLNK